MDGQVIGINTAIISPTGGSIGIGFAVPSEIAVGVVDQLRQYGETRRGWLGVRIQQVTDQVAKSLAMSGPPRGALVAGVDVNSPAAKGGIEAGDVILSFDGEPVQSMHDLPRIVAGKPVGKAVVVHLLRSGKEQDVNVTLGRLEEADKVAASPASDTGPAPQPDAKPAPTPMVSSGPLGLSLSDLSPDTRTRYGIADAVTGGVVVTGVSDGSPAADKRMQPGDVIVEIGHEAVKAPDDVKRVLDQMKSDGRKNVLFAVQNKDGNQRWVVLPLD
jgi:serine protease Do